MAFETLPDHNLQIPEFHPVQVAPPPVYNTAATIAPLLKLAEYMSPESRAHRKALIAKANYEYWLYGPKGRNVMWNQKLQQSKLAQQKIQSEIDKNHATIDALHARSGPEQPPAWLPPRAKRQWMATHSSSQPSAATNVNIDLGAGSNPPPIEEPEDTSAPEQDDDTQNVGS